MLFVPASIPFMVPEAEAHYSTSGHTHSNPTGQLTIEYLSISEFVTSSGESKVQYIVAGYAPAGTITKEIIKPDGTMGATDHESHGVSSGDEWHQSMGYVLDPFNGDGWTMKICAPEHGLCAEQNFNISFAFLDPTPTITASAYLNATASYEKFTGSTYFGDLMSYHPSPYVDGTIETGRTLTISGDNLCEVDANSCDASYIAVFTIYKDGIQMCCEGPNGLRADTGNVHNSDHPEGIHRTDHWQIPIPLNWESGTYDITWYYNLYQASGNINGVTGTTIQVTIPELPTPTITTSAIVNATSPTGRTLTVTGDDYGGSYGAGFHVYKDGDTVLTGPYSTANGWLKWDVDYWQIPIPTDWEAGTYDIVWTGMNGSYWGEYIWPASNNSGTIQVTIPELPTPTITASAYLNATASYDNSPATGQGSVEMRYHPSPYVDGTIETGRTLTVSGDNLCGELDANSCDTSYIATFTIYKDGTQMCCEGPNGMRSQSGQIKSPDELNQNLIQSSQPATWIIRSDHWQIPVPTDWEAGTYDITWSTGSGSSIGDYSGSISFTMPEPPFPPLERAPAGNARVVDAFGSSVSVVSVGQQIQIAADVSNGQDVGQPFTYLVQVRDDSNVPVSLAWITGHLTVGQSISPALAWTPQHSGTYTAEVFIWESVDNPIPLSPPTSTTVTVGGGGGSIFSVTQPSDACGVGTVPIEGVCHIPSPDSVGVNADVYDYGNEITISGNFANYDGTSHITILVFGPNNNLFTINQIAADSSGAFSIDEIATGIFSLSGTYTVKAYLGDNVLQTTFLISDTPESVQEITSFTTYTDPQDRFTIEVPSGWVQSNYDAATGMIDFEDHVQSVHAGIYIWYGEGLGTSKQTSSDSANLESLEDEYAAFCSVLTMEADGKICYNYQLLGSEVVPIGTFGAITDESRTKYIIGETWTIEWADGTTKDRFGTVVQFIDGDDVWEIITWIDDEYREAYTSGVVLSPFSFLAASPAESIQEITSLTTYTDPQGRFTIDVPSGWINGDGTIPDIVGIDQTYYEDTGQILITDTDSFDSWNAKLFVSFYPNMGAGLSTLTDSAILTFYQDAKRDGCQSSSSDPHYYCYNHQTLENSVGFPFSGAADQSRKMYQLKGTYSVIYDPAEYPNRGSVVYDKLFIETLIIDGIDAWEITMFADNRHTDTSVETLTQSSLSFMAASQSSLIVNTNKSSYTYGETIEIVGFVDGYDPSDPMKSMDVNVMIWEPSGDLVAVAQVPVASTGQYSTNMMAGGMISDPGTYTVRATWGAQQDETYFEFEGATLSNVTVTNAPGSSTPGCEDNNECFIPNVVTILPGGTVTWENTDNAAHTATSGDSGDGPTGVWDSSLIMAGGSYSVTLDGEGTYDYFCMVHPWMSGTVVVGDGSIEPEPEPELESEEPVVVCDSGIVINGVCQIEVSQPELNAYVGQNEYNVGDEITVNVGLINTESNEMVIIDVSDPMGNPVVTRAVTVSPGDNESIEFRISDNFLTGSYRVVASSTIDGNTITDITFFKIKSQYNQFQISSVEVTDQQGNPSTLTKGTLGYIKVSLTSDASITALVTVNLFDADLTTLGVGSVRSNIGEGESEIILSFLIPDNAVIGEAEIFVNGFTDWISSGGVPLTGEFSITEDIT